MRKEKAGIFPSKHYITSPDAIKNAAGAIEKRDGGVLRARFTSEGKYLEEERLRMRTKYDLEMLLEVGLLLGHRELFALPRRNARLATRRARCSTSSRRTRSFS